MRTTTDLINVLFDSLDNGTIAERNSVARVAAAIVGLKQLEFRNADEAAPLVLQADAALAIA